MKSDPERPDEGVLSCAAKILKGGGLVAFPTETVYGIAADYLNKDAIDRLYRVKARPRGKPFTVHIAQVSMVKKMGCKIPRQAQPLVDKFWPGPLTLILRSSTGKKIGFRMPANRIALELIKMSKIPLVAPSANLSGKKAPVCAREVLGDLDGKIDLLIDGGRTRIGVESTVVDLTVSPPKVLREGAISREKLLEVVKLRA